MDLSDAKLIKAVLDGALVQRQYDRADVIRAGRQLAERIHAVLLAAGQEPTDPADINPAVITHLAWELTPFGVCGAPRSELAETTYDMDRVTCSECLATPVITIQEPA